MYTTCVIWGAFLVIFFYGTGNNVAIRITSMSITISLSAYVTIACLFSPKVSMSQINRIYNARQVQPKPKVFSVWNAYKECFFCWQKLSSQFLKIQLFKQICNRNWMKIWDNIKYFTSLIATSKNSPKMNVICNSLSIIPQCSPSSLYPIQFAHSRTDQLLLDAALHNIDSAGAQRTPKEKRSTKYGIAESKRDKPNDFGRCQHFELDDSCRSNTWDFECIKFREESRRQLGKFHTRRAWVPRVLWEICD